MKTIRKLTERNATQQAHATYSYACYLLTKLQS